MQTCNIVHSFNVPDDNDTKLIADTFDKFTKIVFKTVAPFSLAS